MITKTTLKDFYNNIDKFLNSKEINSKYIISDTTEISYGFANDINIDWCVNNNIPTYNINRSGGCIVHAQGSIALADIRPAHKWIEQNFTKCLYDWLKNKNLNAVIEGNDILIDGYKVASSSGYNIAPDYKFTYTCCLIAINQDLNVIKNACTKEMIKEPKALSDWGITTDEAEQFIIDWYNKYQEDNV